MTRKQFEQLRTEIEAKKFNSVIVDPVNYGIQRLFFEKERLNRLIAMGETVAGLTVKAKVARWRRKLERADKSLARFQNLQNSQMPLPAQNKPLSFCLTA